MPNTIADDIAGFAHLITDQGERVLGEATFGEFKKLVKRRNDLMHANPGTVGGEQRLIRHGTPWQVIEIDDLADEFAACFIKLNDLHHHMP